MPSRRRKKIKTKQGDINMLDKSKVKLGIAPIAWTNAQEEYDRVKQLNMKFEIREHGFGRPTKRDRRQIDYLKDFYGEEY